MNSVTYILYSEDIDYCILIDCGEWNPLKQILKRIGKTVRTVLITHGHIDHISGLSQLIDSNLSVLIGTNVYGHEELRDPKKNMSFYHGIPFVVSDYHSLILKDGMTLHFDGLAEVEVMDTPGHSQSCLTYKIGNCLFTGDAYIPGIETFAKFPGGNKDLARQSMLLLSIMENNGYKIYPGHHSYGC